MKIYFDMNIYNRVFDDQTQMRVRFESMAIDILHLASAVYGGCKYFVTCDDKFVRTVEKV